MNTQYMNAESLEDPEDKRPPIERISNAITEAEVILDDLEQDGKSAFPWADENLGRYIFGLAFLLPDDEISKKEQKHAKKESIYINGQIFLILGKIS